MSKHGEHKALLGVIQHSMELGYLDTTPFEQNAKAEKLLQQWEALDLLKREKIKYISIPVVVTGHQH